MRESADSFSTFSCFIVVVEVIERVDIVAILVVVNIMTAVKVYLRCCCCYGYRHAGDLILHCSSCTIETFLGTYCKHLRNWEQRVASWSSRWSLHSHIHQRIYTHTLFGTLTLDHDHDQSPQPHVDGLWGHRYRHNDTSCCTNNQELQPRANFTNSKYCLVNAKDGGGGANNYPSRIERMTPNSRQPATLIQLFAFTLHSRL